MIGNRMVTGPLNSFPSIDTSTGPINSASLRGHYHKKIPAIINQPLNTLLPILKNGAQHPTPYYISPTIVLTIPARLFSTSFKSTQTAAVQDNREETIKRQKNFEETIVKALEAEKAKRKADARKESLVLKEWIKTFLTITINEFVEDICWSSIWDMARTLNQKEIESLQKSHQNQDVDPEVRRIIQENRSQPLTSEVRKLLKNRNWNLALYLTFMYMQRASVASTQIFYNFQDKLISQCAGRLFIAECLKYMSKELDSICKRQKEERPVRYRI